MRSPATISMRHRAADGSIHAAAVAPALDTRLGKAVTVQPGYVGFDLPGPEIAGSSRGDRPGRAVAHRPTGRPPVLLCSTRIRLALRGLTERQFPQLTVLSYEEILPSVTVQVHAQVEV